MTSRSKREKYPRDRDEPFVVKLDSQGCATCGGGAEYSIVGPDGIALSETWSGEEGKEEADHRCAELNEAFDAGLTSRDDDAQPMIRALAELVRLKELKDRATSGATTYSEETRQAMMVEHNEKKGAAWDAAWTALHEYDPRRFTR